MSGHSKWSTIKHKKGAEDKQRGKLFTKLSRGDHRRREGGRPDPDANATLATAIAKARSYSMPKDNIERAIARGDGRRRGLRRLRGDHLRGLRPGGRRDHRRGAHRQPQPHRRPTFAAIFTSTTRAWARPGSVAWQFERKGVILVRRRVSPRTTSCWPPPTRAPRTSPTDERAGRSRPPPTDLARGARRARGRRHRDRVRRADDGAEDRPSSSTRSGARKLLRLIDALEDHDDVQDVYANFDIPDAVLEAVAG